MPVSVSLLSVYVCVCLCKRVCLHVRGWAREETREERQNSSSAALLSFFSLSFSPFLSLPITPLSSAYYEQVSAMDAQQPTVSTSVSFALIGKESVCDCNTSLFFPSPPSCFSPLPVPTLEAHTVYTQSQSTHTHILHTHTHNLSLSILFLLSPVTPLSSIFSPPPSVVFSFRCTAVRCSLFALRIGRQPKPLLLISRIYFEPH